MIKTGMHLGDLKEYDSPADLTDWCYKFTTQTDFKNKI